jgi:protein-disulfide isomerase
MPDAFAFTRRRVLVAGAAAAGALAVPARAQEASAVVEMAVGDADAPVTVIEYASLTCPHCANFHLDVLPQMKAAFIDTGKVRLVYREVYFDRPSLWAAMIARCAGEDRYFGVIELLFRDQANWSRAADAPAMVEALYAIGRQAGLTDAAMDACLQDQAMAEAMVAEFQKNATADGVEATPTFIVDGEKVENLPWPEFEARLNEALGS